MIFLYAGSAVGPKYEAVARPGHACKSPLFSKTIPLTGIGASCAEEGFSREANPKRRYSIFSLFLIDNRERVVSKDDLLASVWGGRTVSELTLASRINAARRAGSRDTGEQQRLICTIHGRGFRFVGTIRETESGPRRLTALRWRGPHKLSSVFRIGHLVL